MPKPMLKAMTSCAQTASRAERVAQAKEFYEQGIVQRAIANRFAVLELHALEAQHLDRAEKFFARAIEIMQSA